jgi:hypothetical protein
LIQAQTEPPGCETRLPHVFLGSSSIFRRLSSTFHRLACYLAIPVALCELHSLASDSLRPCEFGRVLGVHATPASFWPKQRPLVVIPGFCIRGFYRCRVSVMFVRVGREFPWIFTTFLRVGFTSRVPNDLQTLRHHFHFAFGRCRPTACSVCTPPLFLPAKQNLLTCCSCVRFPL